MSDPNIEEFKIELNRVVDRLLTMPVTKLTSAANSTRPVLAQLATMAGQLTPVPVIADRALGFQCAVLGKELMDSGQPCTEGTALLRDLRLALW
ncbi:MAG: hypothetical protein O2943_09885 [Actinomycetota bacterium]|nr:hypothetical protein [Actinomycetota bacterium]